MPATTEQKREADHLLKKCGWVNMTSDRYFQFQRGFAFGLLAVDNDPGELTLSAMRFSAENDGHCSENFAYVEFADSQDGEIILHRDLPRALEVTRDYTGKAINVDSGARSEANNRRVGGSKTSAHRHGAAADSFTGFPSVEEMVSLGVWSGIGGTKKTRKGKHGDVRGADRTVPNPSSGAPQNPTLWAYPENGGRWMNAPRSWRKFKVPANAPGFQPLLTWKTSSSGLVVPEPPAPPKMNPGVPDLSSKAAIDTLQTRLNHTRADIAKIQTDLDRLRS